MRPTVVVIAKEPVAGRVKTRLCPPCTPTQSAALAEAALADTLAAVAASAASRRVLALDGGTGPWLPGGFEVVPQRGAGLGERLAAALCDVGGPALVVGMDTPQVTAGLLDRGLELLAAGDHDAVLGRADDGGWWALGLRDPDPAAFEGVPMSTPVTGQRQHERLRSLGLRVAELPPLRDVDDFDDALAVAEAAPHTRFARLIGTVLVTETAVYQRFR